MKANNTEELYAIAMFARGLSAAVRYSLSDHSGDVTNVREYANGLDSATLQVRTGTANEHELDAAGTPYGSLRERYERMAAKPESPWFERTAWRDALTILTAPHGAPVLFGSSPHYADIYGQGWHYGAYEPDDCECEECLRAEAKAELAGETYETPEAHLWPTCETCGEPTGSYGYNGLDGAGDFCERCVVILSAPSLMDDIIEQAANG